MLEIINMIPKIQKELGKSGDYVRVIKLSESATAELLAAAKEVYRYGEDNDGVSLPVDYWVEGYLLEPIRAGFGIHIDRRIRNGFETPGEFTSSPVMLFNGPIAITRNSKYLIMFKQPGEISNEKNLVIVQT